MIPIKIRLLQLTVFKLSNYTILSTFVCCHDGFKIRIFTMLFLLVTIISTIKMTYYKFKCINNT